MLPSSSPLVAALSALVLFAALLFESFRPLSFREKRESVRVLRSLGLSSARSKRTGSR